MTKDEQSARSEAILARTLQELRQLSAARRERRRWVGGATLLGMAAALVAVPRGGEQGTSGEVAGLPELALAAGERMEEELPAVWGEGWRLLLVMDEGGVEMRAMSDAQISALARKPGCEFEMDSRGYLVVSDCGSGEERFAFGETF